MNKPTAPDLLEIVFTHRNRAYGAYTLRREYPGNLGKALGLTFLLLALLALLPGIIRHFSDALPQKPLIDDGTVVLTEPSRPEPPKANMPAKIETKRPQQRATRAFAPPVVLRNDLADNNPPTHIDELLITSDAIGPKTQPGGNDSPPSLDDGRGFTDGLPGTKPVRQTVDSVYAIYDLQKSPSFPGGEIELLRYLTEHIRYPALARQSNIEGIVAIGFVVDQQGRITDATVLREIGGGCGTEALRVIREMPLWSPGEANGHAVRVRFTVPVRFQLK